MKFNALILIFFSEICLFGVSWGDGSTWKSGPPDGLPELSKLSVDCGKEEMTINLKFTAPYEGTVYSKSNGQTPRCIHVAPHSHITEATFSIDYHSCGTRSDSQGKYYENTIIIQYDDIVIEAWDEAKKIRCEWHDGYEKSAYKMPITISDLDVVEMNFQGDDVDCWLEVQDGKGPWSAKVEGLVPLGSPLTLVVAIQDSESQFDMRVKSCIAHDGHKHPIHLTDEDGCVLRPKMMSPFQKTTETKGTASVIAYSHFYAFKFPETVEVTIQCTVEICRHGCPDTCMQGRDAQTVNPGVEYMAPPAKEQEDIPTYKDSHPFSTVITSKPGNYNYSSTVNTSSSVIISSHLNETKDEEAEPLKSSPDTHHDFYTNRFPYDLYDLLEAEERQDKNEHELYTDVDDNDYEENKDDIYFSQTPNVFTGLNEEAKQFSTNQKIQNVSTDSESSSEYLPKLTIMEDAIYTSTENTTSKSESEIADKPGTEYNSAVYNEPDNNTESLEIEILTENPANEESISTDQSQAFEKASAENTLNQLFSSELYETDSTDLTDSIAQDVKKELLQKSNPTQIEAESIHKANNADENIRLNHESNDNDANEDYQDTIQHYHFGDKRMYGDSNKSKKLRDRSFEDYKIKSRRPVDNNEMRHNLHDFNYRPFMPPAPVPPLTLYNGVPLYYYNHPVVNAEVLERDAFHFMGRQSFHKEYAKSKLRRPGRRRGRRDIGEKEQLGLKQTLRVIATTDFDFLIKENEKIKPVYIAKTDADNDVCIAPSSFAAGLGLLLLANICVLCVVVFLGHHYHIHRNMRVKNTELLSTEMS